MCKGVKSICIVDYFPKCVLVFCALFLKSAKSICIVDYFPKCVLVFWALFLKAHYIFFCTNGV